MSMEAANERMDLNGVETAASRDQPAKNENANEAASAADDLESALNAAMASQRWLVAVWHVSEGRLHLYREANDFPDADIGAAQRLLQDDLGVLGCRGSS